MAECKPCGAEELGDEDDAVGSGCELALKELVGSGTCQEEAGRLLWALGGAGGGGFGVGLRSFDSCDRVGVL